MRAFGRLQPYLTPRGFICRKCARRIATDSRAFEEGDSVILHDLRDRHNIFTKSLHPSVTIQSHHGTLSHKDIIGKRLRDIVETSKGVPMRIYQPTLDEYVRYTPRLVTPIYPADANTIVNLLDLHPDVARDSKEKDSPRLEILEAGTGHGGLTLHLARAIHAANPPSPSVPDSTNRDQQNGSADHIYAAWKEERRAVIHSIDVKERYSKHARNIVRRFRRGMYFGNVDFHVGDIAEFVNARFASKTEDSSEKPFLSYAVLDLPSAIPYLDIIAKALRIGGKLVVFNPSITQIVECRQKIYEQKIPLTFEKSVELGVGMSGGREWDIRPAFVRAKQKQQLYQGERGEDNEGYESATKECLGENFEEVEVRSQETIEPEKEWVMVCRPKVGKTITGGGFVGLWSKKRE